MRSAGRSASMAWITSWAEVEAWARAWAWRRLVTRVTCSPRSVRVVAMCVRVRVSCSMPMCVVAEMVSRVGMMLGGRLLINLCASSWLLLVVGRSVLFRARI